MTSGLDEAAQLAARHGLRRVDQTGGFWTYLKDCWRLRHFAWNYALSRTITSTVQNNLGMLWELFTPLLLSGVYYLAFGVLLGTRGDSPNFVPFLIAGVFTWQLLGQSIVVISSSLRQTRDLSESLLFPRVLIPIAAATQAFLRAIPALLLLYPIAWLSGLPITWWWLLLPLNFLLTTLFGLSIGLFTSRAIQKVQDLQQIVPIIMRAGMFVSGVFYSVDKRFADAPEVLRAIAHYNPLALLLDCTRAVFMPYAAPTAQQFGYLLTLTVALLAGGVIVFWRSERLHG